MFSVFALIVMGMTAVVIAPIPQIFARCDVHYTTLLGIISHMLFVVAIVGVMYSSAVENYAMLVFSMCALFKSLCCIRLYLTYIEL